VLTATGWQDSGSIGWRDVVLFWKNFSADKRGERLIHYAIKKGHSGVVSWIYSNLGCFPHPIDSEGRTILHLAIHHATRSTSPDDSANRWAIVAILIGKTDWYRSKWYAKGKGLLKFGKNILGWMVSATKGGGEMTFHGAAAVNAGSNVDAVDAANHLYKGGKAAGKLVMDAVNDATASLKLKDERRVDRNGNNALHYLFLPLLAKTGAWEAIDYQMQADITSFLTDATDEGCDPSVKNNAGQSPMSILEELISKRSNAQEKETLQKILTGLQGYVKSEKFARKAKAGVAAFGAWKVAALICVPLTVASYGWWFAKMPGQVLGLDFGAAGNIAVTFASLSAALYFLKDYLKRMLGWNN